MLTPFRATGGVLARMRQPLACAALGLAASLAADGAAADNTGDWPNGPVTFVVPFSAGGGGDTLARLYGKEITRTLNTSVVIDNRPGAGGNIGTALVAKAKPDGSTFVFGTSGTMGTNHALYKGTGFTIDAFEPVAMLGSTTLALVVGTNSPFQSVGDLVDFGKKNPNKLACASGGNGTASHIACAMLQQLAGIKVDHIPYKGTSTAIIDLKTDRISFFIDVLPPLMPQIKQGGLRVLAVTMGKRVTALPETPTMIEAGVPGFEHFTWDGIFVPKGTPAARLDKLHAAIDEVLKDPAFRKDMAGRGTTLDAMSRQDFANLVRREYTRMGGFVRKLGVTID